MDMAEAGLEPFTAVLGMGGVMQAKASQDLL